MLELKRNVRAQAELSLGSPGLGIGHLSLFEPAGFRNIRASFFGFGLCGTRLYYGASRARPRPFLALEDVVLRLSLQEIDNG